MKIVLRGKIRSNQSIYKTTCRNGYPVLYMTTEGKQIKKHYKWQIKKQYEGEPMTEDLEVWVNFFFPTKRKRDIDNYCKILLDSLEGIVYEDDEQIQKLHLEKEYRKNDAGIKVKIKKC